MWPVEFERILPVVSNPEDALGECSMSTVPVRQLTPEEYLEIERTAETKSEYYRGEMFAMSRHVGLTPRRSPCHSYFNISFTASRSSSNSFSVAANFALP